LQGADDGAEVVEGAGFEDVGVGTEAAGFGDVGGLLGAGHHDDDEVGEGVVGADPLEDFVAIAAGHFDVEQDEGGLLGEGAGGEEFDDGLAVRDDVEGGVAEGALEEEGVVLVILGGEDGGVEGHGRGERRASPKT
jgi:hypothetical protein